MPRTPLALELQSGKSPSFLAAFHAPFWSVPLGILRVDRALTFRPIQALCPTNQPTNQPTSDLREEAGEQWTETLHWHNAKKKKRSARRVCELRGHTNVWAKWRLNATNVVVVGLLPSVVRKLRCSQCRLYYGKGNDHHSLEVAVERRMRDTFKSISGNPSHPLCAEL